MTVYRVSKFWTRKCRNGSECVETEPHTHHMTWFGRLYFRLRFGG